jgi:ornithine cyclodeaminase/alanine dehydrogenase-like protein (mu-crystallin family)
VLPGCTLHLFDRSGARATSLAEAARATAGIGGAEVHDSARAAVEAADVVISAAAFGPAEERQSMTNAWLRPGATIVPIDYATYCAAEVARDAALFLVDQREQYLANRDAGNFDGYPDPSATIGEAILAGTPRPPGRVVVSHLGVGLADLVFADAIVRAAVAAGRGTVLQR